MKKVLSLLLVISLVFCLAACGENANTNTGSESELSFDLDSDLPAISFTGNSVEAPYEQLPEISTEKGQLFITVTGYEAVKFAVPMSLKERLEKIGNNEQTNLLYLEQVPQFNFTFPEELTDEILAEYTECEPKITSVQAEKAYTNSDGTIYIYFGKSGLGDMEYVYQIIDANGKEIASIYYNDQSRKVYAVHEFPYDYEDLMVRHVKILRSFFYTDGIMTNISITAEANDYSDNAKESDTYYSESNKAEMNYTVTNGKISALSDCSFFSSYDVNDLTDKSNMSLIYESFHSYYDKSGNLTGISLYKAATEADKKDSKDTKYYYIIDKGAWYTEDGDKLDNGK